MQRAVKSLENGQFMSESEYSSSVDETDNEDELIKRMEFEEFNKENDMYEEGSQMVILNGWLKIVRIF